MLREVLYGKARASSVNFGDCYSRGYELVVSKHGQMLYDGVSNLIIENLNRLLDDIISLPFRSGHEKDLVQRGEEEKSLEGCA
jgi:cullin 3